MFASDTIHDAIRAIYDAATAPERWPATLQKIADCTGDVGAVLLWRRDDGSFGTIVSPSLEASQAEYEALWATRDIRAVRVLERGFHLSSDVATDGDVVTDDEIADLPIYRDFLFPQGLGWFAAVSVAPDPRVRVFVSVQRARGEARFGDAERRLVGQLGRHVEQALRLGMRLIEADVEIAGLTDVLATMRIGVFGLDALGRVTMSNPSGQALIDSSLRLREGRLVPLHRDDATRFVEAQRALLGDGDPPDPKPILLQAGDDGTRLVVQFLPVGTAAALDSAMMAQTRLIALVVPLEPNGPVDPTLLRDLLGLTLNESRVASLVGSGLQPRSVAEHLGITEETTRTVLKRVFSKIGVSRQAELVGLLARLNFTG